MNTTPKKLKIGEILSEKFCASLKNAIALSKKHEKERTASRMIEDKDITHEFANRALSEHMQNAIPPYNLVKTEYVLNTEVDLKLIKRVTKKACRDSKFIPIKCENQIMRVVFSVTHEYEKFHEDLEYVLGQVFSDKYPNLKVEPYVANVQAINYFLDNVKIKP